MTNTTPCLLIPSRAAGFKPARLKTGGLSFGRTGVQGLRGALAGAAVALPQGLCPAAFFLLR